jgi:MYXO-CTERM domain-containing protein
MIRFLLRLTGFLLLAAGFVALVVDGTRSIASNSLRITSLADSINQVMPGKLALAQSTLAGLHPSLWDPAMPWLISAPTGAVLSLIGLVLLWLGRPRREMIGFATR